MRAKATPRTAPSHAMPSGDGALLLRAESGLAGDALPLLYLIAQLVAGRVRTAPAGGEQDGAEIGEAGEDRGFGQRLLERGAQARHDRRGRAARGVEGVPLRDLEAGKARLAHGREVLELIVALGRRDREGLDPAALDLRDGVRRLVAQEIDLAADHVVERRPRAAIRDLRH